MIANIVTGFGKTYIVHTSDFGHLQIHSNHGEWLTDLKLSGVVKECYVVLPSMQVSHLSVIAKKLYELPKSEIWMCELCTFLQIQSHIMSVYITMVTSLQQLVMIAQRHLSSHRIM